MSSSVRWGRKGRGLALVGGFACSVCAFAQDPIPASDLQPAWLEQVLQTLERVEAEQRALRQEIEALRVQHQDALMQGPDDMESESEMDPAALFEAEEEHPVQEDPPEIRRILKELAHPEAEQAALRREVEGLGLRQDGLVVEDPGDSELENGEAPEIQDEWVNQDPGALATAEEETPAPVLEPEESEPPLDGDRAEDEASVPPDEEPVFSLELYQPAARLYEQGREAFRNLNFYDAAKVFREFLTKYPTHEDVGEARYWLGEALYVEGRFQDAIAAFAEVVADDANPRREVARLKTGYAWFELGDLGRAEAILVEVRDQNPGSDLARLAQLRLDRLQRRAGGEQ